MSRPQETSPRPDRRQFVKGASAAAVAGSLVAATAAQARVHNSVDDTLKVALIGCGGRGTGAAVNAVRADENAKITVLCDAFPDRIEHTKQVLANQIPNQFEVADDHCFSGFDGYKQVMASDVDVVLLCSTPAFRPAHLAAAVEAGKHIFCEKPVAVDSPGVRSVLETSKKAEEKGLCLVSGLCWRYDLGVVETMNRIFDGAIGEVKAIQENYLTGTLWHRGNDPKWSQMEYQMRNWLYYTWLSGDHIAEQHIHSLDKALWLNGDTPPAKCFGLGGRQVRTEEQWGHIYDHFAVCYEWANGVKAFAYTRQMAGCYNDVDDYVMGTKGSAQILKNEIVNAEGTWRYKGPSPSMYDVEHQRLFAAIRSGTPINNGTYMSYSTLMAIMGREACYTGKSITWDEAMADQVVLGPTSYEWGDVPTPKVALPGRDA
ncbi:MAG TPA: oxidoreductase [Planctomycetaceae bacterium]|nr:oxidoreductase [Planctomycetaceae bacterium]HRE99318.1 Gfo/Idh/MocA family oxidoreductase [Pirellulaceae bacterium]